MDVITMESSVFVTLEEKIDVIYNYIKSQKEAVDQEEKMWVDTHEAAEILMVSERTLQRLRSSGDLSYSAIKGKYYYSIAELRKMIERKLLKSKSGNASEMLEQLKQSHQKRWRKSNR